MAGQYQREYEDSYRSGRRGRGDRGDSGRWSGDDARMQPHDVDQDERYSGESRYGRMGGRDTRQEFLSRGRGGTSLEPQRFELKLSAAEWQDIVQLAERSSFDGLPEVIGCPDCADGGAESLEISGPGVRKSVKFDHGANVPQIQPLLDRVRVLRTQLTPKQ